MAGIKASQDLWGMVLVGGGLWVPLTEQRYCVTTKGLSVPKQKRVHCEYLGKPVGTTGYGGQRMVYPIM